MMYAQLSLKEGRHWDQRNSYVVACVEYVINLSHSGIDTCLQAIAFPFTPIYNTFAFIS